MKANCRFLFVIFSLFFLSVNVYAKSFNIVSENDLLILVDNESKLSIENFNPKLLNLVSNFGDFILIRIDKNLIKLLNDARLNYNILDNIEKYRSYYYVWPLDDKAERGISNNSKILFKRDDFFVIRLEDTSKLDQLMKFRVELAKISLNPIKISSNLHEFPIVGRNSIVQEIVNRVNSDSVFAFVCRLCNFQTRYSSTDSCLAAAEYIKFQFETYGLDSVYFQDFDSTLTYAPNVIGIKRGTLYPDSIYTVLCGHYDCISYQNPFIFSPGADDNGSGATSVIEAVRAIQGYNFEKSLRFIAFCGEEQGLLGSDYYAIQARNHNDSIIGVINVDMVAYSEPDRDSASIIGKPSDPNCAPLVDYFIACADSYTLLKTQRQIIDRPRSDHASFNQYDFVAIQCRENLNIENPYYHLDGDTIGGGFNDLNLCTEVAKAAVATVTSLAVPVLTGITEAKANHPSLRITPNPSSKMIQVEFIPLNNKGCEIKIIDIVGRIRKEWPIHSNSGFINLDIGFLKSGIYFLEINTSNNRLTNKLIIR